MNVWLSNFANHHPEWTALLVGVIGGLVGVADKQNKRLGGWKMKYWLEAQLETEDREKQCSKCRVWVAPPRHIFVEFILVEGSMPHPDELHQDPTGKVMCEACSKMTLI